MKRVKDVANAPLLANDKCQQRVGFDNTLLSQNGSAILELTGSSGGFEGFRLGAYQGQRRLLTPACENTR
jgi:hypothetical protein